MDILNLPDPERILPERWQAYGAWLSRQANPSLAYGDHPHISADTLPDLKNDFQACTGMDLDDYIRLRRLSFLLSRSQSHSQYRAELAAGAMDSPFGQMLAICSEKGVCMLKFIAQKGVESELLAVQREKQALFGWRETPVMAQLRDELARYFQGSLREFGVALDLVGNDTQREAWHAMTTIPYGETRGYAQLAAQLDKSNATRHIAAAAGQNKTAIIVPCHRVNGHDHISSFAAELRQLEQQSGNATTASAPVAPAESTSSSILPPPTGLGWRKS